MAAADRRATRSGPSPGRRGRARAALLVALAVLGSGAAHAQVAGSMDLDSAERYRGTGTDGVTDSGSHAGGGPVLRASVMADATGSVADGAYAGLSGLWRTRDGRLANAEAMAGWSGRWNALGPFATASPDWGWDIGAHRMHYGAGTRYDFSEAMLGLMAPNASLRMWWSPHYFGGAWSSLYSELNANVDLDERWRLFAHLGTLRYGRTGADAHVPGRTDALVGAGWRLGPVDLHLTRDGLVSGRALGEIDPRGRRAAWVLGTRFAF